MKWQEICQVLIIFLIAKYGLRKIREYAIYNVREEYIDILIDDKESVNNSKDLVKLKMLLMERERRELLNYISDIESKMKAK